MRLYSKKYQGKQANFRDADGQTWTIWGDVETGEVFWVASTGAYVDGYGAPIEPWEEPSVEGEPAQQFYYYPSGGHNIQGVIEPETSVYAPDVTGVTRVAELVELPDEVADFLLAHPALGESFVPWRDAPKPVVKRRRSAKPKDEEVSS